MAKTNKNNTDADSTEDVSYTPLGVDNTEAAPTDTSLVDDGETTTPKDAPADWVGPVEPVADFTPADFAARMTKGKLTKQDDEARVAGWLGNTQNQYELNYDIAKATGGHDNVWPVTNPARPADETEMVFHPGIADSLIRDSDRESGQARFDEARGNSEKAQNDEVVDRQKGVQ